MALPVHSVVRVLAEQRPRSGQMALPTHSAVKVRMDGGSDSEWTGPPVLRAAGFWQKDDLVWEGRDYPLCWIPHLTEPDHPSCRILHGTVCGSSDHAIRPEPDIRSPKLHGMVCETVPFALN